ncbi:MAG: PH domain-containing protein [Chloroflexota bacterium]
MLLKGQGLTIERPARSAGTAIGIIACGLALALAIALLVRGLGWPTSWPAFAAYVGAGVMVVVASAFAFWTWACITMRYTVGPGGVTIRWGPIRHQIPITRIEAITAGRMEQNPRVQGIGWMGYHVGRGRAGNFTDVLFFSTHRSAKDIVYVSTADTAYAISPRDPARFAAEIQRFYQAAVGSGDVADGEPTVERDIVAGHPIWSDRTAQAIAFLAVLVNVVLWGYIFANYPHLSNQITIEFPPIGSITTLHARADIFKIPFAATAILATNMLASLLFQPRERAATYLLLTGSVFFQAAFLVAAVVAIVNA